MSLFWLQGQSTPVAPVAAKRNHATATSALDYTKLSCRQCPLDREPLQHPKMPPTGAARPIFYMLGEAPGENEDREGEQFIGESGRLIRDRLPSRWADRVRWNNTLRCRPPKNRDPSVLELACCRKLQEDDIEEARPAVILAFGGFALQWLVRGSLSALRFDGGRQRGEYLSQGGIAESPEAAITITQWRGRRLPVRVKDHTCWVYPLVHPAAFLYMRSSKNYEQRKMYEPSLRCFEHDLERVFADFARGLPQPYVEPLGECHKNIEIVTEFGPRGLQRIAERLGDIQQRPNIALDIETNGLRPWHLHEPKLLSCAVGTYDDTLAFGIDHPECRWSKSERTTLLATLYRFIMDSGRKWAHSLKFEQEWLRFIYDDDRLLYETQWGDTLAQAHALDERKGKALDNLVLRLFGFPLKAISNLDRSRLAEYPLADVLRYNGLDTKYTDGARALQADEIETLGVQSAYEGLVRLTPSLVRMQAKGLVRDLDQIKHFDRELEVEENDCKRAVLEDADFRRFALTRQKASPTSNQDLLAFFKDFMRVEGISNVDEEALSKVDHPVARLTLQQRKANKRRSTYIVPLLDGGKNVALDGLVHANFNHLADVFDPDQRERGGTVTSRLSSFDPNLQNFPRRKHKEIRRVIGAPPGHKFVAFDYGQLEARVVAILSADKTLMSETWRGDDIHGVWADKIGTRFMPKLLKQKDGRKLIRDGIKNLWTFPEFFGSAVEAIAKDLSQRFEVEISPRALQPYHDEFWDKYRGVLKWQDGLVSFYQAHGYVETATGFRRHEPLSRNELINQPVQGTAAQIVLDGQHRIDRIAYEQGRPSWVPTMNVHDDLSFYLELLSLEEDIEGIAREMCCSPYKWVSVPLSVEVSLGDNWCDKTELHTFKTQDFQR